MSNEYRKWAYSTPFRGTTRWVLVVLAEHADTQGMCWPSLKRIADMAGITVRSVSRSLDSLQAAGYLRMGKRRRRNFYQIGEFGLAPETNLEEAPEEVGNLDTVSTHTGHGVYSHWTQCPPTLDTMSNPIESSVEPLKESSNEPASAKAEGNPIPLPEGKGPTGKGPTQKGENPKQGKPEQTPSTEQGGVLPAPSPTSPTSWEYPYPTTSPVSLEDVMNSVHDIAKGVNKPKAKKQTQVDVLADDWVAAYKLGFPGEFFARPTGKAKGQLKHLIDKVGFDTARCMIRQTLEHWDSFSYDAISTHGGKQPDRPHVGFLLARAQEAIAWMQETNAKAAKKAAQAPVTSMSHEPKKQKVHIPEW